MPLRWPSTCGRQLSKNVAACAEATNVAAMVTLGVTILSGRLIATQTMQNPQRLGSSRHQGHAQLALSPVSAAQRREGPRFPHPTWRQRLISAVEAQGLARCDGKTPVAHVLCLWSNTSGTHIHTHEKCDRAVQ